ATTASPKAEARLIALGVAPKEHLASFERERARSDALLASKQFSDAAQAYVQLLAKFPEAAALDQIHLRLGLSLVNSRQPAQAVAPLARVNDAALKPEAMFYIA